MKISLSYKTIILSTIIIVSFCSVSCRKTRYTTNIEKTWKVDNYYKNGVDSTSNFNVKFKNYSIIFNNDNGFIERYTAAGITPMVVKGMWLLINRSKSLQMTDSADVRVYDINKLKIKSMILKKNDTGEEIHYSPQ
jgi:hypothetical protein